MRTLKFTKVFAEHFAPINSNMSAVLVPSRELADGAQLYRVHLMFRANGEYTLMHTTEHLYEHAVAAANRLVNLLRLWDRR